MIRKIEKYYMDLISEIEPDYYDFVLFINPETITPKLLMKLKDHQPNAKFILYMWDSIKNKNAYSLLPYFDKKLSFDRNDCSKYGMKLFLPLFFLDHFSKKEDIDTLNYDYSFIGSIHSDRYRILSRLQKSSGQHKYNSRLFLFFSNKIAYFINAVLFGKLSCIGNVEYSFKSIPKKEVASIISQSKAIVDIQHPKQLGMTMRTIEILGMKKKLITTNSDIINYDFYHEDNIYILDRKKSEIDKDFLNKPFREIPEHIYSEYTITNWLSKVLNYSKDCKGILLQNFGFKTFEIGLIVVIEEGYYILNI